MAEYVSDSEPEYEPPVLDGLSIDRERLRRLVAQIADPTLQQEVKGRLQQYWPGEALDAAQVPTLESTESVVAPLLSPEPLTPPRSPLRERLAPLPERGAFQLLSQTENTEFALHQGTQESLDAQPMDPFDFPESQPPSSLSSPIHRERARSLTLSPVRESTGSAGRLANVIEPRNDPEEHAEDETNEVNETNEVDGINGVDEDNELNGISETNETTHDVTEEERREDGNLDNEAIPTLRPPSPNPFDFLPPPSPQRRQLRKRAFAAIYPYVADQIRYLRLANIADVNQIYDRTQDAKQVMKLLEGMYQRNKRKFPTDDKYRPKSFAKILGEQKRQLQQQQQLEGSSQVALQLLDPWTAPALDPATERRVPRIIDDDEEELELFDFEADEAELEESSSLDTDDEAIQVGGREVRLLLALRGVLPESAKRLALWKRPQPQAKRQRTVEYRRGLAQRKRALGRAHDRVVDLINDIEEQLEEEAPVAEVSVQQEAAELEAAARRMDRYQEVYDDVDPNAESGDDSYGSSFPLVIPQIYRQDSYAVESGEEVAPVYPASPVSVSDDSDILEYDYISLHAPGETPRDAKPRAKNLKSSHSGGRQQRLGSLVGRRHGTGSLGGRQQRLGTLGGQLRQRSLGGTLGQPGRTQYRLGPSRAALQPYNRLVPKQPARKTARAQAAKKRTLNGTLRTLSGPLGTLRMLKGLAPVNTMAPGLAAKQAPEKAPKPSRKAALLVTNPYMAPLQFTIQVEAESSRRFVLRKPKIAPHPLTSVAQSPMAQLNYDKIAQGTLFVPLDRPLRFNIDAETFTLSTLTAEGRAGFEPALKALVHLVNTSPLDLEPVFHALAQWMLHHRLANLPRSTASLVKSLLHGCRVLRWFPMALALAFILELSSLVEEYASKYWRLFWENPTEVSPVARLVLLLTGHWWSLMARSLTSASVDHLLVALDTLPELARVYPRDRDGWPVVYAVLARLDKLSVAEATPFLQVIDTVWALQPEWSLPEKLVIELYSQVTRRKFSNFADECTDPELLGVVRLRGDFGPTFFDQVMLVVYMYVGELPVESHRDRKRRLMAKLYSLSQLKYRESRDQYTMYVNRLNFTLLLHQVLGLRLGPHLDLLVAGVVDLDSTLEFTTLQTSIQALRVYADIGSMATDVSETPPMPAKAIRLLFAKFTLGYLKIPKIGRLWKQFVPVLEGYAEHPLVGSVLASGFSADLPAQFALPVVLLIDAHFEAFENEDKIEKTVESMLHRLFTEDSAKNHRLVLLLIAVCVKFNRNKLVQLVYGKLRFLGTDESRHKYGPTFMTAVVQAREPTKPIVDAVVTMVFEQLVAVPTQPAHQLTLGPWTNMGALSLLFAPQVLNPLLDVVPVKPHPVFTGNARQTLIQILLGLAAAGNAEYVNSFLDVVDKYHTSHWQHPGVPAWCSGWVLEVKKRFPKTDTPQFRSLAERFKLSGDELDLYAWAKLPLAERLLTYHQRLVHACRFGEDPESVVAKHGAHDPMIAAYAIVAYMRLFDDVATRMIAVNLRWFAQVLVPPATAEFITFHYYLAELAARYPASAIDDASVTCMDRLLTMVDGYIDETPRVLVRGFLDGHTPPPPQPLKVCPLPLPPSIAPSAIPLPAANASEITRAREALRRRLLPPDDVGLMNYDFSIL